MLIFPEIILTSRSSLDWGKYPLCENPGVDMLIGEYPYYCELTVFRANLELYVNPHVNSRQVRRENSHV